jgi:hypothetical protein
MLYGPLNNLLWKTIPAEIKIRYDAALFRENVRPPAHFYYRKWRKYYLGFSLKYHYEILDKESLPYFLKKLKDKNQTEQQQKQAFHAVSIFYEIESIDQDRIGILKIKKDNISTKKTALDAIHADWSPVYSNLEDPFSDAHG